MTKEQFASGQCLCGDIKYSIASEPLAMVQCHCNDCRKSTGTGHASNAFFKRDDVTIEGNPSSYSKETDTGSVNTRYFCTNCGSRVFSERDNAVGIIGIAAGCLDDSSWYKAKAIAFNKSKPSWDIMDSSIPAFEEMPPPPK